MARILIGNIKGPKGDTGAQGPRGETGPQGPQGPLPPLVNNALATEAGVSALDAVMGKTLQDQITNNKNDITQLNSNLQNIFLIPETTLEDVLYTGHNPGLYKVNDQTANNPTRSYGVAIILKDASSGWIFVIIIPTNLTAVYTDFYNGYMPGAGWSGWRKADLVS